MSLEEGLGLDPGSISVEVEMEHQVCMDFLRDSGKNAVRNLSLAQHQKLVKTVKKLQRNKEKRTVGIRAQKCIGSFQACGFRCVRGGRSRKMALRRVGGDDVASVGM